MSRALGQVRGMSRATMDIRRVIIRFMRLVSAAGVSGSVLTLGVTALYVAILVSEGDDPVAQSAPWAVGFATVGLAGFATSFVTSARVRLQVFSVCATAALLVGLLAIFSIGVFLVVAGLLFATAAWSANAAARG